MFISHQDLEILRLYQPKLRHEPSTISAAIAIILRDTASATEFLLIQRAIHKTDPWSGQMAFPGGKVEASDASQKATAIRETVEEVAIELTDEDYVGQLDDIYGQNLSSKSSLHISCFVFKLSHDLVPKGNYEVADCVWLPLSYLDDTDNAHEINHPKDGTMKMPAVMINQDKKQILWGLSLRMLGMLFAVINKPISATTLD